MLHNRNYENRLSSQKSRHFCKDLIGCKGPDGCYSRNGCRYSHRRRNSNSPEYENIHRFRVTRQEDRSPVKHFESESSYPECRTCGLKKRDCRKCGVSFCETNKYESQYYDFQGFQGNEGSQGFQGSQGLGTQGSQGFQGNTGFQGSQGLGTQGFQGNTGSQGLQGNTGFQGSQGLGIQGFQGNTGSQGFQGDTGFQGSQGFQGNTGLQGFQGRNGDQGFQGNIMGGSIIPIASGGIVTLRANINGSTNTVSLIADGSSRDGVALTGGNINENGLYAYDFVMPRTGTLNSIAAQFTTTSATIEVIPGFATATITIYFQIYTSDFNDDIFSLFSEYILSPPLTSNTSAISTVIASENKTLVIGTKVLVVFSIRGIVNGGVFSTAPTVTGLARGGLNIL